MMTTTTTTTTSSTTSQQQQQSINRSSPSPPLPPSPLSPNSTLKKWTFLLLCAINLICFITFVPVVKNFTEKAFEHWWRSKRHDGDDLDDAMSNNSVKQNFIKKRCINAVLISSILGITLQLIFGIFGAMLKHIRLIQIYALLTTIRVLFALCVTLVEPKYCFVTICLLLSLLSVIVLMRDLGKNSSNRTTTTKQQEQAQASSQQP